MTPQTAQELEQAFAEAISKELEHYAAKLAIKTLHRVLKGEHRILADALDAPPQTWQPIETAPKDDRTEPSS